jgi:hypothetical protein
LICAFIYTASSMGARTAIHRQRDICGRPEPYTGRVRQRCCQLPATIHQCCVLLLAQTAACAISRCGRTVEDMIARAHSHVQAHADARRHAYTAYDTCIERQRGICNGMADFPRHTEAGRWMQIPG